MANELYNHKASVKNIAISNIILKIGEMYSSKLGTSKLSVIKGAPQLLTNNEGRHYSYNLKHTMLSDLYVSEWLVCYDLYVSGVSETHSSFPMHLLLPIV